MSLKRRTRWPSASESNLEKSFYVPGKRQSAIIAEVRESREFSYVEYGDNGEGLILLGHADQAELQDGSFTEKVAGYVGKRHVSVYNKGFRTERRQKQVDALKAL